MRPFTGKTRFLSASIVGAGLTAAGIAFAQQTMAPYTAAQAAQGRADYMANCAGCHQANLSGGGEAPSLAAGNFMKTWGGKSTRELYAYIRQAMPLGKGGSLPDATYANIVAFLLAANGATAGGTLLNTFAVVLTNHVPAAACTAASAWLAHRIAVDGLRSWGGFAAAGGALVLRVTGGAPIDAVTANERATAERLAAETTPVAAPPASGAAPSVGAVACISRRPRASSHCCQGPPSRRLRAIVALGRCQKR